MNDTIEEETDFPLRINDIRTVAMDDEVLTTPNPEPEQVLIKQEPRRTSEEPMRIPKEEPNEIPFEDEENYVESDDAVYSCEKCGKLLKDQQELIEHHLTHTPKNQKMNGLSLDDLRDEEIASLNTNNNPSSLYYEAMDTRSSPIDFYTDGSKLTGDKDLENEDSIDNNPYKSEVSNTNGTSNESNQSGGSTPDTVSINGDDENRENIEASSVSVTNAQENEPKDTSEETIIKQDEVEKAEVQKNEEKVVGNEGESSKTTSEPKLSIRAATQLLDLKPENVLKLDQSKKQTSDSNENGFSPLKPTMQYDSSMDVPLDPNSSAGFVSVNQIASEGTQCEVCGLRCPDGVTLEQHKSTLGHHKCHYSRTCSSIVFQSTSELIAHQQTVHSAVGQLTSQVQRIQPPYQQTRLSHSNYTNVLHQPPTRQHGNIRQNSPIIQQRKRTSLPQPVAQPMRSTPIKRRCDVISERKGAEGGASDVLSQLSKSITTSVRQGQPKKPSAGDTAAVASILSNRGLTVSSIGPAKTCQRTVQNMLPINLNSAVSLIPTNSSNARSNSSPSNRLPTVDLTGPDVPRGRRQRTTCDICDKTFSSEDILSQHMMTHRNPRKQGISRESTFSAVTAAQDMAIPIVDLKQPGMSSRLSALGINYVIPLSALGAQSSTGSFSVPILSVGSNRNTSINLAGIGASSALPLGPLMSFSKTKF